MLAASALLQMRATGAHGPRLAIPDQLFGLGAGFFRGPRSQLYEQKAPAGRQLRQVAQSHALAPHEVHQQLVESLKANGPVLQGPRNRVCRQKCIGKTQYGEQAERRAGAQVKRGRDDVGAGSLGAHQRAGHVEVVLRQQFVEVVSGDTPRNARELLPHQLGILVADSGQPRVDGAHASTCLDFGGQLLRRGGAHRQPGAVVEQNVEGFDVVHHFAAQQPVNTATVVADHASESAAGVRRGVGRKGKVVFLGGIAQVVENNARLYDRQSCGGIDHRQFIHEARIIEYHGHIGALASETGSGAARKHRRALSPAGR